ncbi:MAG: hypothetical protein MUF51_07810, partial [Vicinamibacteria bacterium]|nr:hypothetical protein [Vicinamibacteria bacterium]
MKLAAIDRWTLGYVLFASSVLILRWPTQPPGAASLALSHVLLAGLAWLAPRARQTGGLGAFLGDWYPLILTSFLYAE